MISEKNRRGKYMQTWEKCRGQKAEINPLSLSGKGRLKRKDKNKGKKNLEQLCRDWRQSMPKLPKIETVKMSGCFN